MAELRWGLLGASRVARNWLLPALRAEPGHEAAAVAARDPERAKAYAAEHGIARAYGTYDDVIADPAIDVVYVGLPNDAHLPWTVRALHAGKHVLCEKPLALSEADVAQMIAAEAASGSRVLEAFSYRFHPQIERLQQIFAAGVLGRLVSLEASFMTTIPAGDFRWTASLGGGSLLDVGCYCLDILRLVAGRPPRSATAVADLRGEVDASLSAVLDFGEGLSGTFACSFVSAREQHFTARGSEGVVRLALPFSAKNRPAAIDVNGVEQVFEPCDPAQRMIAHFGRAIRGEEPLRWPLTDSLAQARAMDLLLASLARN